MLFFRTLDLLKGFLIYFLLIWKFPLYIVKLEKSPRTIVFFHFTLFFHPFLFEYFAFLQYLTRSVQTNPSPKSTPWCQMRTEVAQKERWRFYRCEILEFYFPGVENSWKLIKGWWNPLAELLPTLPLTSTFTCSIFLWYRYYIKYLKVFKNMVEKKSKKQNLYQKKPHCLH